MPLCLGLLATIGVDKALADPVPGPGTPCPADGGTFTVGPGDTINAGFDCGNVRLVIPVSVTPSVQKLNITAAEVIIGPPAAAPPALVEVINDAGNSEINIRTTNNAFFDGDIIVNRAALKAHKKLGFTCVKVDCRFEARLSQLIAATDFANPDAGGGLFFNIKGPIDIQTTQVHGGDTLEMKSVDSSITLLCAGGPGACKLPLDAPIDQRIRDACGVPPGSLNLVFPCNIPFPTAASLTAICSAAVPGVLCNGGNKEKRFTAGTFLDFTGSTITSDEHVTFTCGTADPAQGNLIAPGATFIFDSLFIKCPGTIDLSNATLTLVKNLNAANVGTQCAAPPAVCVNLSGANITAGPLIVTADNGQGLINACDGVFTTPGNTFPKLNNDTSPPYSPNVDDTGAECNPAAAAQFCNANNQPPNCVSNP